MDIILSHIYFEFPTLFIVYLIILHIVNKSFSLIIKNKWVFYIHYISVWIHELCHFLAAIICLKIPKFNKIKITSTWWRYRIEWSVNVKNYSYKSLINTLITWEKVTAFIFLIWEIISWFIIWLAPIIIPLIFTYYLFWSDFSNISDVIWKVDLWWILLLPFYMLLSHISNVSTADIKHALPWIMLLVFVKIDIAIIKIVLLNMALMWIVLLLSLIINLILKLFWIKKKSKYIE